LAYDQVGLIGFEILSSWIEFLFKQLMRSPPENYQQVSMDQILSADKQLFIALASLTRTGITALGRRPLEDCFPEARADPQVAMLLMPLPLSGAGQKRKLEAVWTEPVQQQYQGGKAKGKGKGRGKGKGKGKAKEGKGRTQMPDELRGMHFRTPNGDSICFGYNMAAGCNVPYCRNKHVCCKPGCYSSGHSVINHPAGNSAV
jgi:hypothetical protein